jgi:hypothetical protein
MVLHKSITMTNAVQEEMRISMSDSLKIECSEYMELGERMEKIGW